MANVTFPRKEFENAIGTQITEKLEAQIHYFGTPVESLTKDEIELEIFPNRPDLLSPQGYLRAFKAFLGKEPGLKKYSVKNSGKKLIAEKSLPKEWPYAIACIVKGLRFNDQKIKEVIDIQEKLGATMLRNRKKGGIGLYPLEKIQFPIRFAGLSPNKIKFRPLEYPKEITGRQILSKHPTGRKYAHICNRWQKLPVFIDNNNNIMSMPPIINSHTLGKIDETTTEIFLEATGTDLAILQKAINIIATSLAEIGGTIESIECVQQNSKKISIPDLTPQKKKISLENANKLLGLRLSEKECEKLLPKMGYEYKNSTVTIPAWRTDILHEVDIIEDLAIAYGYNNITPELPNVQTVGKESKQSTHNKRLAEVLAGLGLLEISSYHLIKQDEADKARIKSPIELEDSKTEYKFLRPNLIIPALRILFENKDKEYPHNLFEIGTIFTRDNKKETGVNETTKLCIALSPGNFTHAKQHLDALFRALNLGYTLKETTHPGLISGRTGAIILGKTNIGVIGETHPATLNTWGLKMPLALIELSLDDVYKHLG